METQWAIDTEDGHKIHGLLNTTDRKNNKAVLIIHGLTGHPREYHHNCAAFDFPKHGYDVIRPWLYCGEEKARKLIDCTLGIHARDVATVTQYFANQYDALYGVGHSFGAPSLILSDTSPFKALCLWDPSIEPALTMKGEYIEPFHDYYLIRWEPDVLGGKAMYDEAKTLTLDVTRAAAEKCTAPTRVILAGDGMYAKRGDSYDTYINAECDRKVISGADHCFNEEGVTEPLLNYTREWFDKFQP